jgi:DNA polymerase-3 subunit epsilon
MIVGCWMYAVFDLVTAGVGLGVAEIAVVRADRLGRVVDQWCRPVAGGGFARLAGEVIGLLRGHTVVAHNLAARALALSAEFGTPLPLDGLCTMRLARYFLPTASRGLDACRIAAGLPSHRVSGALPDARAAADLLAFYLRATGQPPPWLPVVDEAAAARWPPTTGDISGEAETCRTWDRDRGLRTRLIERLPRAAEPSADGYLELLDRALLDRRTDLAAGELRAVAGRLGTVDVEALHRLYLADLAAIGRELDPADGARAELTEVAALLGMSGEDVDAAMTAAKADGDPWRLRAGDTVVFAGMLTPSRDRWLREARDAGLVVGNAVTRKTRLLVTADPEARTGNAEKARRYQVPIVHPTAYREILRRAGPRHRNSRFA